MTLPTLPSADPDPEGRARALGKARDHYTYVHGDDGMLSSGTLPPSEADDLEYYAKIAAVMAELGVNKLAKDVKRPSDSPWAPWVDLYATIAKPEIVSCWQQDDVFAWQAVAGPDPVMLRRLDRVPDHLAVRVPDDLLARGRVYVADYAMLDGLPSGTVDGLPKYNFAPIAVYLSTDAGLVAHAIQCGQTPDAGVFSPTDGVSWSMARQVVAAADGNVQGIVSHFALCHQVMEAVILSARRELSERHPLLVLLEPHFRDTLVTNDIAKKQLYSPGGNMDRLQSPTLAASLGLARRQIADFRLLRSAPHEDALARGVLDREALPVYPFRDDGLLVWEATRAWVDAYVRLAYPSDAEVDGDVELRAFVDALGAPDQGGLGGLVRPRTVTDVVELVARIVFRCTTHHASINYSSFPLYSFAPNEPTAAFAPGPTGRGDTEEAWRAMLPPPKYAYQAIELFYEITVRLDELGGYRTRHFADPRVAEPLAAFRAALSRADAAIDERNATRLLAYPYMKPSQTPQSIQV